ncbi:alanine--tRNA ligase [Candidatus Pacearchaeota archaeon]|nr:alanine--tRNA ligase [Candidatus Pacearchaeota archaeon]
MNRKELIKGYIDFFKSKDHKEIKNSSLVPENDPTVLFTMAGMHPLVPYLLGEKHPQGNRLVNVQRCIRTGDIDEVGDTCHHTFFEMLGNWSLGDYFKKETIEYSFEFLTKVLGLDINRIAVSVFKGDKDAPKDEEAAGIWEKLEIPKDRIAYLDKKENWWGPAGETGPCGPDTEMFYWKSDEVSAPKSFDPEDDRWVEIWNDVFMQYNKDEGGKYNDASQKNVDTGLGVERTIAVLGGLEDNYLASMWKPIVEEIEKLSAKKYSGNERAMRIIADHIKAAVFIIADGVVPGNSEQGYVLRRLIRRAVRYARGLGVAKELDLTTPLVKKILKIYDDYDVLKKNKDKIIDELNKEEDKFEATLDQGIKQLEKVFSKKEPINSVKFNKLMKDPNKREIITGVFEKKLQGRPYSIKDPKISEKEIDGASLDGKEMFLMYQSYGFPLEMIDEMAMAQGLFFSHNEFRQELAKHQKLSRTASAGKFKSGLADNSEETKKLHTATHLLNESLRVILDKPDLHQKGSNITPERIRFDFNFDRKLTAEELKEVEDLVNLKIQSNLPIVCELKSVKEAKKDGAKGVFDDKYGSKVKVYHIGSIGEEFSKEICAGPHVDNTSQLGHFKIVKESSSSAGVRRIKAVLE